MGTNATQQHPTCCCVCVYRVLCTAYDVLCTVYCVLCTVYCTPMISPARSTTIALNLSITLPFAPTSVRSTQLGALPFVHARTESEGASVVVVELLLTHADMLVLTR